MVSTATGAADPNQNPNPGTAHAGRRRPLALPKIFLSYRRADTQATTRQLRVALTKAFGPRAVFRDVESIKPGDLYLADIEQSLRRADVQLVIIGRQWLTVTNPDGTRRIDDPGDTLAHEIALGLSLPGLRVIPVVVDDALLPTRDQLPARLQPLIDRNGRFLRDTRWDDDVEELAGRISERRYRIAGVPRPFVAAGVALAIALAGAAVVVRSRPPGPMGDQTFNVAVARFQALDDRGKPVGGADQRAAAELGAELAKAVAKTPADLRTTVQVWRGDPGPVRGDNDAERLAAAAKVQQHRNADLVVFGTVNDEGGQRFAYPGIYLDSERISNDLYAQFDHTYSPQRVGPFLESDSVAKMAAQVGPEVTSLVRLLGVLTLFRRGNFDDAAAAAAVLDDPKREPGWHRGLAANPQRAALVAYVRAVAALGKPQPADAPRSSWYAEAEQLIDVAREADPTFKRAEIIRAQIDYQRGSGVCDASSVDPEMLRAAIDRVTPVAQESTKASIGDDHLKARTLAILIEHCRAAAGLVDEEAAVRWAQAVLRDTDGTDPDRAVYAATAHQEIGWDAGLHRYDWDTATKELQTAIDLMRAAAKQRLTLTSDPLEQVKPLENRLACLRAKQQLDEEHRRARPDETAADLQAFRSAKITDAPCP